MQKRIEQLLAYAGHSFKPAGNTAAELIVTLEKMDGRADVLGDFLGTNTGELLDVTLDPPPEDLEAWSGLARVKASATKPPGKNQEHPQVVLRLEVLDVEGDDPEDPDSDPAELQNLLVEVSDNVPGCALMVTMTKHLGDASEEPEGEAA